MIVKHFNLVSRQMLLTIEQHPKTTKIADGKCSGKQNKTKIEKRKAEEASCINGGTNDGSKVKRERERKFMLQEIPCLNICTENIAHCVYIYLVIKS